jgi:CHAD domain-containing protein
MSFVLGVEEKPGIGLERAIREQVKKLVDECERAHENPAAFAHKARVRAKKIRAALRLARPLIGAKTYRKANRWWRDAARTLSGLRDAGAGLEALESLKVFLTPRIGTAMMARLTERFEAGRDDADATGAIDAFRALLASGKPPALEAPPGQRDDVVVSLTDTYRSAREAMSAALEDKTPEKLHEWRKQTKYHALQVRLLRNQFPDALQPRLGAVRDLSDILGEAQDIEIVLIGVRGWPDAPKGFREALKTRRGQLVTEAERDGATLFAEKPKAWARLLGRGAAGKALDPQVAEADL